MFGELSQLQIEDVLREQLVGRIGCNSEGMTYIVPISYAYDDNYVYAHTLEGMKTKMMRINKNVCFEVDTMQNVGNWQSVIAWGVFEEITNETERHNALQILHRRILPVMSSVTARLSPEWPFSPDDINAIKGIVFRIRLDKKTGRFENNSVPSFLAWG
jgi:nitroimidazol reductase NimA-like FMN-containing flavoprotein (pyridoxamine 5'-phosphate oxidase superfamily)